MHTAEDIGLRNPMSLTFGASSSQNMDPESVNPTFFNLTTQLTYSKIPINGYF